MKRPLPISWRASALLLIALAAPAAQASGLGKIRFVVIDPVTGRPAPGYVTVDKGDKTEVLA